MVSSCMLSMAGMQQSVSSSTAAAAVGLEVGQPMDKVPAGVLTPSLNVGEAQETALIYM